MALSITTPLSYFPMPERPLNPTPLEMIIYLYELKAHDFHNARHKAAPKSETPQQKAERAAKEIKIGFI